VGGFDSATVQITVIGEDIAGFDGIFVDIEPGSAVPGCESTDTCLTPSQITIVQGQSITWRNQDTSAHTRRGSRWNF